MQTYGRLECCFMSGRGLPLENAPLIAIPAQFWRALRPELYIKDASMLGLEPPEDFAMRTLYASKFIRQLVVNIPVEQEPRLRWVAIVLQHISEARRLAPWVTWLTVEIDGVSVPWDESSEQYLFQNSVSEHRGGGVCDDLCAIEEYPTSSSKSG
jgi:hypothetical protein